MSGAGKRRRRGGGGHGQNGSNSPQNNHAQYDGASGGNAGQRPAMNSPPGSPKSPLRGMGPPPGTPGFGSIQGQMMGGDDVPLRDPARDPERSPKFTDICRNIDLPSDAYSLNSGVSMISFVVLELQPRSSQRLSSTYDSLVGDECLFLPSHNAP
ncbi:hypothetical protein AJ79_00742 [Helicocarpus griseus UAMH5409]|uniref:Uncharacterized protein n=1 Tax=Helicocarpus griseus UAMH5409 TaxID=1447875 RepID=A0A2B7Y207_9EURO|nr:hypothetical protein AJ79_00742 [Helicocarpus griseus UAMH5409]